MLFGCKKNEEEDLRKKAISELEYVNLPYADRKIFSDGKKQTNAISLGGNIGYTVCIRHEMECNSFYDENEEFIQSGKEEARILYVAMTRAISSFTWITNMKDNYTWNRIMQEGLNHEH